MQRVLLCGKSLWIAGLQASLSVEPELELQWVDAQPEDIREQALVWQPDVLILEAGLLTNGFPLWLLQNLPELKLIGLDVEDNRLWVFSGAATLDPTPERLLEVIKG